MMVEYKYKAINQEGDSVSGVMKADGYQQIINQLEQEGLQLYDLAKIESNKGDGNTTFSYRGISFNKKKNVLIFTRQLANLLKAGVQINEAMKLIIALLKESNFKNIIINIHDSIKEGNSFASSLKKYPAYFSHSYISMIQAGEESGYLALTCERLADEMEEAQELRSFIISCMIYPVILIVISFLAIIVMLVYVLPKFASIYAGYNQSLPLATMILLNISTFIINYGIYIAITIIIVFVSFNYYFRKEKGRLMVDRLLLQIPFLGSLYSKLAVARITGGMGILLKSGVPLLKSLKIIRGVSGNSVYSQALENTYYSVERGSSLSHAFSQYSIFPELVAYMLGVAEQTGKPGETLTEIGTGMFKEYKRDLERFMKIFEPLLLLIVGLIIAFIVFSMLLPVIRINTII